jgi:hypothetical protein
LRKKQRPKFQKIAKLCRGEDMVVEKENGVLRRNGNGRARGPD